MMHVPQLCMHASGGAVHCCAATLRRVTAATIQPNHAITICRPGSAAGSLLTDSRPGTGEAGGPVGSSYGSVLSLQPSTPAEVNRDVLKVGACRAGVMACSVSMLCMLCMGKVRQLAPVLQRSC